MWSRLDRSGLQDIVDYSEVHPPIRSNPWPSRRTTSESRTIDSYSHISSDISHYFEAFIARRRQWLSSNYRISQEAGPLREIYRNISRRIYHGWLINLTCVPMTKEPSTALWRALTSTPAQQLTIPSTDQSSVDSESPRPIDLTELAEDDATKGSETTISASLDEVDSKEYIRKRKRGEAYKLLNHGSTAEDDIDASPKKWARFDRRRPYQRRQRFVGLRLPELVYPKSQYVGWTPPLPRTFESVAVQDLMVRPVPRSQ